VHSRRQDGFDVFLGTHTPSTFVGGSHVFADRRPLVVQAVPYLLAASVFMVVVAMMAGQTPGGSIWPMRVFVLVWLAIGAWSWNFIYKNGMLYVSASCLKRVLLELTSKQVNWPKLNTPRAASEGLQETLGKVKSDPVMGRFVGREHATSTARFSQMEEGKKRIQ